VKLLSVDRNRSPRNPEWTRLTGVVAPRIGAPVTLWFEVPSTLADHLTDTGNPWLALLLPYAVSLREPLELPLAVDPMLFDGALATMQVWDGWYPGAYPPVELAAELLPAGLPDPNGRTGSLFSAGLDSFFTLCRNEPGGNANDPAHIDDLLTVWGIDIPIEQAEAFERLRSRISEIAATFGKTLVIAATNFRDTPWAAANWGMMGQGPALAALGLFLERRYRRLLLPASVSFRSTAPWGTHPLVDPLMSTGRMAIRDDGALLDRLGKCRVLPRWPLAMQHLRVCWAQGLDTNCGRCEKCLRTLTMFELQGALAACVTFPAGAWSLDALAGLRLRNRRDRLQLLRLRNYALDFERTDIARAIDRSVRRYDLRVTAGRMARAVGLRRRRPN
jgi:hypothetical protein